MKQKKLALAGIVILVALLLVWGFFPRNDTSLSENMPSISVEAGDEKESANGLPSSENHPATMKSGNLSLAGTVIVEPPDLQILHLQELLDDGSQRAQALAKAVLLAEGTVAQQLAAIEAFRWFGGNEAVKTLITLRKEGYPEVAEEAGRVLAHLLTEGIYSSNLSAKKSERDDGSDNIDETDEGEEADNDEADSEEAESSDALVFDPELWEKAIREAPSELDRDELMILLSAYPGTTSIPILLNILESEQPELREHALEYLEFVTYGEKITNRQEAEDWLATHGAMEEYTP